MLVLASARFAQFAFSGEKVSRFAGENSAISLSLLRLQVHLALSHLRQLLRLLCHLTTNNQALSSSISSNSTLARHDMSNLHVYNVQGGPPSRKPWRTLPLSFALLPPSSFLTGISGYHPQENFGIKDACRRVLEHCRHKQLNFVP